MSKGGSFARRAKCAIFFCHVRKKKCGSFESQEDLLPKKKPIGKFLREFDSQEQKFPEEIFLQESDSGIYIPSSTRNINSQIRANIPLDFQEDIFPKALGISFPRFAQNSRSELAFLGSFFPRGIFLSLGYSGNPGIYFPPRNLSSWDCLKVEMILSPYPTPERLFFSPLLPNYCNHTKSRI